MHTVKALCVGVEHHAQNHVSCVWRRVEYWWGKQVVPQTIDTDEYVRSANCWLENPFWL